MATITPEPSPHPLAAALESVFNRPLKARHHWLALALLATLAGGLSLWLGADANWDLRNYHLYNPWALLENRWQQDIGWNVQWFLNPLPQLPYYLMVRYGPDTLYLTTALMGLPGALVAWVMLLLFRELGRLLPVPGWALGAGWLSSCSGAVTVGELGTTFNDLTVTLCVLLGMLSVLRGIRLADDVRWPALGFFAFGAAMGLKITFGLFVLGPALAWFFTRPRVHALWPGALAATSGLVMVGGWWFALLYLRYESPVFPFFNAFFESPWWTPITERDGRFDPQGTLQTLFYPFYWWRANTLVSEVPFAEGRISLGLMAAVCLLWPRARLAVTQRRALRFLALVMLLTYLIWLKQFAIYRYLLPLELLAPVCMVALFALCRGPSAQHARGLGTPAALALCVGLGALWATTQPPNWGRVPAGWPSLLQVEVPYPVEQATVMVAQGDPPLHYLAVGMPGPERFISVNPNLRADTLTGKRARQWLAQPGPRYWVMPAPASATGPHGWAACFGLKLEVARCRPVKASDPGVPQLVMCPVKDRPASSPTAENCQ